MLVPFHAKMIDLIAWISGGVSSIIITSAYRPNKIHENDSGIASTNPCRHLDIRSWIYEDPRGLVSSINKHWLYDPKRPNLSCAVYHNTGQGIHIHLQVHDNTQYKEK